MGSHRFSAQRAQRLRQRLLDRDGNHCTVCNQPFDPALDGTGKPGAVAIKRIIQPRDGGTNAFENLGLAHRACEMPNTRLADGAPTMIAHERDTLPLAA